MRRKLILPGLRPNKKAPLNRLHLPTTGPLDSEPDVDLVVDVDVDFDFDFVIRNKRFAFITTVPLSSSPARKVAGAHRQPARERGIKAGTRAAGWRPFMPRKPLPVAGTG